MVITATELKTNLGKYLDMVHKEDILITKNGKTIAKLTAHQTPHVDAISGILAGKVPNDIDRHSIREMRLEKYESGN